MELYRWIIKPDKKRHVIQDLQKPIAEFLLSLDFVTPKLKADGEASMIRSRARIMQWTEAFQQLNHFCSSLIIQRLVGIPQRSCIA